MSLQVVAGPCVEQAPPSTKTHRGGQRATRGAEPPQRTSTWTQSPWRAESGTAACMLYLMPGKGSWPGEGQQGLNLPPREPEVKP